MKDAVRSEPKTFAPRLVKCINCGAFKVNMKYPEFIYCSCGWIMTVTKESGKMSDAENRQLTKRISKELGMPCEYLTSEQLIDFLKKNPEQLKASGMKQQEAK